MPFYGSFGAFIAKPMPNWRSNPKGVQAIRDEAIKFEKRGVWDQDPHAWATVSSEARDRNEVVHRARVFGLVTVKGSELQESEQKVKGRLVLGGDQVTTSHWSVEATFTESSSSPAAMTAYRSAVLLGSRKGFLAEQADAEQAYIQATLSGLPTWGS